MIRRLFVCLVLLPMVIMSAQEDETPPLGTIRAYFEVDDQSPRLGEPVMLTAIVELPPDAELVEFPEFPSQWDDFVVLEVGELTDDDLENDWLQYRQPLTVILWDVGDFETPETLVGYMPPDGNEPFYVPFSPVFFTVPSMLNPDVNLNQLRPLKPQIGFFYLPWWAISAMILMIVSLGYAVRLSIRRWGKPTPIDVPPPSPEVTARDALRNLRDSTPEVIYTTVPDVLRRYIEARFGIPALEMTTDELIERLTADSTLDESAVEALQTLFHRTDMVKFAGTPAEGAETLLKRAYQWIEQVRQREDVAA